MIKIMGGGLLRSISEAVSECDCIFCVCDNCENPDNIRFDMCDSWYDEFYGEYYW